MKKIIFTTLAVFLLFSPASAQFLKKPLTYKTFLHDAPKDQWRIDKDRTKEEETRNIFTRAVYECISPVCTGEGSFISYYDGYDLSGNMRHLYEDLTPEPRDIWGALHSKLEETKDFRLVKIEHEGEHYIRVIAIMKNDPVQFVEVKYDYKDHQANRVAFDQNIGRILDRLNHKYPH